jgi:hypothetical protein
MRYILTILIAFAVSGCHHTRKGGSDKPSTTLEQAIAETRQASKQIKEIADRIDESADSIAGSANAIGSKVPEEVKAQVQPDIDNIIENTVFIKGEANNLRQVSKNEEATAVKLEKATKSSIDMEKEILELQAERDEAVAKQRKADRAKIMWLVFAGIVMTAGSLAACSYGLKASGFAIFGIFLIITSLTVSFLIENLEWVGGVAVLVAVLLIGYTIYRQRKERRATEEVVHTMEVVKDSLPEEQKGKIFGNGALPGVAFQIQSDGTEERVREIRNRFRPSWEHTVSSN